MKKSELRKIIRESIKELLTESFLCTTSGNYATCECGDEPGACPPVTIWGHCGAGGTGTGAWNGFDSCSKYCKGGCNAKPIDPDKPIIPKTPYTPDVFDFEREKDLSPNDMIKRRG